MKISWGFRMRLIKNRAGEQELIIPPILFSLPPPLSLAACNCLRSFAVKSIIIINGPTFFCRDARVQFPRRKLFLKFPPMSQCTLYIYIYIYQNFALNAHKNLTLLVQHICMLRMTSNGGTVYATSAYFARARVKISEINIVPRIIG